MKKVIYALLALAMIGTSGCTVRGRGAVRAEPVSTVEVTSAPVPDYAIYPHTEYEGRTVYYVDNRWGYPDNGHWVYYRYEPAPLVRYRTTVDSAPRAPHRYPSSPPPQSAPPATRVR
jgi:hypothetical protein